MRHRYYGTHRGYVNSIAMRSKRGSIPARSRTSAGLAAWDLQLFAFLLTIVLFILVFELKLLQSEIRIQQMELQDIDYDAYRRMQIKDGTLAFIDQKVNQLKKKYPYLNNLEYIDPAGYLTFSMMANTYDLNRYPPVDEMTFRRGIARIATAVAFRELYGYNKSIFETLEYFPVPRDKSGLADIYYEDSWLGERTYGGNRKHEGTDLMATNNRRGYFPILSITDGLVEKIGWLEQGGYRVGIRSGTGAYFYYAHLESYASELKEGDTVIAGQLLGFMGDSGYGSEGTVGQFDVHLHLGIYVDTPSGEMSVNPYWIMKTLEKKRIVMDLGQEK